MSFVNEGFERERGRLKANHLFPFPSPYVLFDTATEQVRQFLLS